MNEQKAGVYGIRLKNSDKWYVGQSVNIPLRWRQHKEQLNRGQHVNALLQRDWMMHGDNAFDFVVLQSVPSACLDFAEYHWCEKLCSFSEGYNIAPISGSGGGENPVPHSEYIRLVKVHTKQRFPVQPLRKVARQQILSISSPEALTVAHHETLNRTCAELMNFINGMDVFAVSLEKYQEYGRGYTYVSVDDSNPEDKAWRLDYVTKSYMEDATKGDIDPLVAHVLSTYVPEKQMIIFLNCVFMDGYYRLFQVTNRSKHHETPKTLAP